ncbi:hypothetical protein K1W54_08615 [Micromonospora sp. CPCC 205371]|nr:hypothetical protein [Micromonospora sp. CPCC 205371]
MNVAAIAITITVTISAALFTISRNTDPRRADTAAQPSHVVPSLSGAAPPSRTVPAPGLVGRVEECARIDRAYRSWWNGTGEVGPPVTAEEVNELSADDMSVLGDDGEAFYDVVNGFDGRASKTLAAAIDDYLSVLAIADDMATSNGKVNSSTAASLALRTTAVRSAHTAYRAERGCPRPP